MFDQESGAGHYECRRRRMGFWEFAGLVYFVWFSSIKKICPSTEKHFVVSTEKKRVMILNA